MPEQNHHNGKQGKREARFALGFLAGLVAGIPMFLPMAIVIAGIMIQVLHVPKSFSAEADLLVMIALYGIWLLALWAIGRLMTWWPFFHGLLCSIPLPTIFIAYLWQSSLDLHNH